MPYKTAPKLLVPSISQLNQVRSTPLSRPPHSPSSTASFLPLPPRRIPRILPWRITRRSPPRTSIRHHLRQHKPPNKPILHRHILPHQLHRNPIHTRLRARPLLPASRLFRLPERVQEMAVRSVVLEVR